MPLITLEGHAFQGVAHIEIVQRVFALEDKGDPGHEAFAEGKRAVESLPIVSELPTGLDGIVWAAEARALIRTFGRCRSARLCGT